MVFRAVSVANIRLGRIGGEEVYWERAEVPVPVGVEDGLKPTVVEFLEEEVLLLGEVAEVMFVRFVQIALRVLHHCVTFECVVRNDGDVFFDECAAFVMILALDWGGNFVLGFVAEAHKCIP